MNFIEQQQARRQIGSAAHPKSFFPFGIAHLAIQHLQRNKQDIGRIGLQILARNRQYPGWHIRLCRAITIKTGATGHAISVAPDEIAATAICRAGGHVPGVKVIVEKVAA